MKGGGKMIAHIVWTIFGGIIGLGIFKVIEIGKTSHYSKDVKWLLIFLSATLGFLGVVITGELLPHETYLEDSREIAPEVVANDRHKLLALYGGFNKKNSEEQFEVINIFSYNQDGTLSWIVVDKAEIGILHNSNIKSHKKNVVRIEKHMLRVRSGRWYSAIFPKNESVKTRLFYPDGSFVQIVSFKGLTTREITMLRTPYQ